MEHFKPPSSGKRGPLANFEKPSKLFYKCLVENCNKSIRGDRLPEHYLKSADMKILESAQKMSEDEDRVTIINLIKDQDKQCHTLFLYKNGYNELKLPNFRGHKRECETKILSPFEQIAAAKKRKSSSSSDSHADDQSVVSADLVEPHNTPMIEENVTFEDHAQNADDEPSTSKVQENGSIYDLVRAALKDHDSEKSSTTTASLSKEHLEQLASMICAKTIQMQEVQQKSKLENDDLWLTTGNMIVCQPCLAHFQSEEIPSAIRSGKKTW